MTLLLETTPEEAVCKGCFFAQGNCYNCTYPEGKVCDCGCYIKPPELMRSCKERGEIWRIAKRKFRVQVEEERRDTVWVDVEATTEQEAIATLRGQIVIPEARITARQERKQSFDWDNATAEVYTYVSNC